MNISLSSKLLKEHTHSHTRLTALCPGLPGWASTRRVKQIWILLKQETVCGSVIICAICKYAPRSKVQTERVSLTSLFQTENHASTQSLSFLQARCPPCRPTNSVKALKAKNCKTANETGRKLHLILHIPQSIKMTSTNITFQSACIRSIITQTTHTHTHTHTHTPA